MTAKLALLSQEMVQGIFDEALQLLRAPGYELKVILVGYNFPSQICFM